MKITMQDITVIVPNCSKISPSNYQITLQTPNGNCVTLSPKNDNLDATIETETAPVLSEVKPLLAEVVQKLLDDGLKYSAIKAVKDATGCGLKPAKLFVDGILPYEPQKTITERVKDLLLADKYYDAIELFRSCTGCDNLSAKAFINTIVTVKPMWLLEVENYILLGKFIDAVKYYHQATETTLLEAKNACEEIRDNFRATGQMK